MKYNPYNWTIRKPKNVNMKMAIYPGEMTSKCVLDELNIVSMDLGLVEAELTHLRKRIEDLESEYRILRQKRKWLLSIINDA